MFKLIAIALLPILLSGCGGNSPEFDACVARGIAYYKEIGSYPKLTSNIMAGRFADDVAIERCGRTTTAF